MKHTPRPLAILLLLAVVACPAAIAQVGEAGYSEHLDRILGVHIVQVDDALRRQRLIRGGVTAGAAVVAGIIGVVMHNPEYPEFSYPFWGVAGGFGLISGYRFLVPSRAERRADQYWGMSTTSARERVDRFVFGETLLHDASRAERRSRVFRGILLIGWDVIRVAVSLGSGPSAYNNYRPYDPVDPIAGDIGFFRLRTLSVAEQHWEAYEREAFRANAGAAD